MNISNSSVPQALSGYLSEKDKRKYTTTVSLLGAAFFLIHILTPVIVMLIAMPTLIFTADAYKKIDVESIVFWKDSVWFIEEDTRHNNIALRKITLSEPQSIETACDLPMRRASLLADDDGIWIISSNCMTQYAGKGLAKLNLTKHPGNITKPFLLHGRPAALEYAPDKTPIIMYDGGIWQKKYELSLGHLAREPRTAQKLRILGNNNRIHLFMQLGNTLYHRSYSLDTGISNEDNWESVGTIYKTWQAVSNDVGLFVFSLRPSQNNRQITAYVNKNNAWETIRYNQVPFARDIGVCSLPGTDRFILIAQLLPGSLRMLEIEGQKILKSKSFGKGFPFGPGFPLIFIILYSCMLILPLIMAIIISSMMRKHRLCCYKTESNELPYASLTRRALAQIIDGLILSGPFALSFILMMSMLPNPENMAKSYFSPLIPMFLMLIGFPWMIACLLIFSATEGSSGATPGKWLLGIRVLGTDLRPCGFGRAFIRNILKFVDGFFNFMVGVMVAALSENWQRVGDMAARTVVVDIKNKTL